MTISYLIGIDGGGTATRARIVAPDGQVVGSGAAGPSALRQGVKQAWIHVQQAIAGAFAAAGKTVADPRACAIGLGLAGTIVASLRAEFLRAAPPYAALALDEDAFTTLLGAHAGRPGAIVTAGTGSVGAALRADGTRVRAGGWGFPVGDEGSGAWLGLAAMRSAQHALDGSAPVGELVRAVWQRAGCTHEELLDWCERAGQHEFAQLAPLVFECAGTDPRAAQLLDDAAAALATIAHSLDPQAALPLAVLGGIGERLATRLPHALQARRSAPAGDAIDGALRLIREHLIRQARAQDVA